MENINEDFINILDVVGSYKHCYIFESRLPTRVKTLLVYMLWFLILKFAL